MNVSKEVTLSLIEPTIFCWRRARVRSIPCGLQSLWRVRASASACLPLISCSPRLQPQRVAAVLEAAVELGDDAAAPVGDAAERVDQLREVLEVDLDEVVDLDPEVLLDGADRERRPADRVGGVDLVLAVAGDVDDGVARDRERRVVAAADPHQQDRVRARGLADLVRARLLGALRARVGAEDEDRVRRRQRVAGAAELVVGGARRPSPTGPARRSGTARARPPARPRARPAASARRARRRSGAGAPAAAAAASTAAPPRSPSAPRAALHVAQPAVVAPPAQEPGLRAVQRVLGLFVVARSAMADR